VHPFASAFRSVLARTPWEQHVRQRQQQQRLEFELVRPAVVDIIAYGRAAQRAMSSRGSGSGGNLNDAVTEWDVRGFLAAVAEALLAEAQLPKPLGESTK
jgi:hypothetical protein